MSKKQQPCDKVLSGEPIVIDLGIKGRIGESALACCDCGLVHQMRFSVSTGHVVLQAWRNKKATKAERKAMKRNGKRRK